MPLYCSKKEEQGQASFIWDPSIMYIIITEWVLDTKAQWLHLQIPVFSYNICFSGISIGIKVFSTKV